MYSARKAVWPGVALIAIGWVFAVILTVPSETGEGKSEAQMQTNRDLWPLSTMPALRPVAAGRGAPTRTTGGESR